MNDIVQFVLKHGYPILFAALFAHQLGLPVPGPLFLLASLVLAIIAAVLGDWPWYEAGRRHGDKVLHFIHRLARDPDAHDRRAKETFARYGPPILVIAKFVPGLDAVTPPLAGISRTSRIRFLGLDAVGAGLYSCTYAALGYVFSHDLERVAAYAGRAGTVLAGLALAGILMYTVRRYRLTRESRLVRITPSEPRGSGKTVANP